MNIKNFNNLRTVSVTTFFILFLAILIPDLSAQEFWALQNGPYGGSALCLAAHSDGTIYAGTQYGGLQKSDDQGAHWYKPGWGGTVWKMIVNHDGTLYLPGSNSVDKSIDGGISTEQLTNGLPNRFTVYAFAKNSSGDVFVSTDSGLYVTRDDGAKWIDINSGFPSLEIRNVFVSSDNHIYVNVYGTGVFRSVDDGGSWQNISDGLPVGSHLFTDFVENSQNDIYTSVFGSGVYQLPKGGTSWAAINTSLTDLVVFALGINSDDDLFCGTMNEGVFHLVNGTVMWYNANNGLQNTRIRDIYINQDNNKIFLATERTNGGGIYTSIDKGKSWQSENRGFRGVRVWDLAVNPFNNNIFAGSYYNGVFRSVDGGANWQPASYGLETGSGTSIRTIASGSNGDLYVATYGGGAYKSIDDGGTWSNITPDGFGNYYHAVGVRENDGAVFLGGYTGTAGVLRSDDGGVNWIDITNNIGDHDIRAIDFNGDGHIYVSTNAGGIFKSENNGTSWQKISNSTMDVLDFYELSISPAGTIFAGAWSNGAYRSTDDGQTWEVISELGSQSLDFVYDSKGTIYAGSYDPWRSKDEGKTWENINSGMGGTVMESYVVDNDDYVYAGTSQGVYKSVEPSGAVRVRFEVKMVYQDGFDPITQPVGVRGKFNSEGDPLVLEPQGDADQTYIGEWASANPQNALTEGYFEYKYVILGETELPEFRPVRRELWNGLYDLTLPSVWFDDQTEFTRIMTSEVNADSANSRGVAWGDYDNDGFADLYIANDYGIDYLYHNEKNGQLIKKYFFSEDQSSYVVSWGDYDNDNDLDLFVGNLAGENNIRYENTGISEFTRITSGPEVSEGGNTTGLLWFDYNKDNFLDLFVANFNPDDDFLYQNNGDNSFGKITTGVIVEPNGEESWGSAAADYDNDGDIDLFVAQYYSEGGKNYLYENQGDGTFISITTGNPIVEDVHFSNGGSWGDYNNDGLQDLYVTNLGEPDALYQNLGEGNFTKVSIPPLSTDSSASRSSSWIDYNNDGWLDLFVVNSGGPNYLMLGYGDDGFEQVNFGPIVFDELGTRGSAWADYDRDGDLDVVITGSRKGVAGHLYRNNISNNNWCEFKLVGSVSNKSAIGTRIMIKTTVGSEPLWQMREISSKTGYLGQNEMIAHFGLGTATAIDSVVIFWPATGVQIHTPPGINRRITISEPTPEYPVPQLVSPENGANDLDLYPEFTWDAVDGAISYSLQLSLSSDFSSPVIDATDIPNPVFQTPTVGAPLQTLSTYFWHVKAVMNTSGDGNWSDVWNFTTRRGTSYEQVLQVVSPPDSAENISRTPTLEWAWINTPPTGTIITYDVQLSSAPDFSDTLWQRIDLSSASVTINTSDYQLEYNKTYFWRARAKTTSTIYMWANPPWRFTTEPFTGTVSILYPPNNEPNVSIPTPLMWTRVPADGYKIQIGTSTDFTNGNVIRDALAVGDDTLIYIEQSMEFTTNSRYYWRVGVISGEDVPPTNWTIPYMFETFDDKVETDFSIIFPDYERRDQYLPRDYMLVGIPGNSGKNFDEIFTGVRSEDWMAYWDNGTPNPTKPEDYLVPHSVSSTFTFVTGRAFWVINKGAITINESDLGSYPLNEMAEALINVHAGYNLITSPFDKPVNWNQIKILNGLPMSTQLYEFDNDQGSFIFASDLERGIGYYFRNSENISPLRVPYNQIPGLFKSQSPDHFDWLVQIDLKSGASGDVTSRIGISKDSKVGFDHLEYIKPRMIESIACVYFERSEWSEEYPGFGSDIRPEVGDLENWQMKVYTPGAVPSVLSFEGVEQVAAEYDVVLIDKKSARYQDLRENPVFKFDPVSEITELEFMVGKADLVQNRVAEIVPHEFTLEQNYPNPFNPVTTIPFALPKSAQIKLTVYNILGKVVNVIYSGRAEAGRHYLQWDGTDIAGKRIASGLYFYHLEIDGREGFTRKMVLMK